VDKARGFVWTTLRVLITYYYAQQVKAAWGVNARIYNGIVDIILLDWDGPVALKIIL
jgi:hypothetical protein